MVANPWWRSWWSREHDGDDGGFGVAIWGIDGLDGAARDRLRQALGARLTQADEIVLRCGLERDVARNRHGLAAIAGLVASGKRAPYNAGQPSQPR